MRERKLVVAGLIVDGERLLISRRKAEGPHGGYWEFPGGKMEPGETPEAALARELSEEIGIDAQVGKVWDVVAFSYEWFDVLLLVYAARCGDPSKVRAIEVAEVKWVSPHELRDVNILPADISLCDRLAREGLSGVRW